MVASLSRPLRPSLSGRPEPLVNSVLEVVRSMNHDLHPALEAEGLSKGEYWALHLVSSLESASISTVARHLALSAPTVCENVDGLEAKGLLVRHRSARDRRTVDLAVTAKGRRVEDRIWPRVNASVARAIVGISREDLATATRVFEQIARHLQPEASAVPEPA